MVLAFTEGLEECPLCRDVYQELFQQLGFHWTFSSVVIRVPLCVLQVVQHQLHLVPSPTRIFYSKHQVSQSSPLKFYSAPPILRSTHSLMILWRANLVAQLEVYSSLSG